MSDSYEDPNTDPSVDPAAAAAGDHWTDSAAGRLVGALVAPKRTFESIRRRPTWVLALVVLLVVGIGSQMVTMSQMDVASLIQEQAAEQGNEISREQAEKFALIQPACGALLVPIGYAVFALLVWGLISLAGGEADFHRAMSIATHATMPQVVVALLSILVMLAGADVDPMRAQLEGGVLTSNLAFLAPEGASPYLVVVLSMLDVFSIWNVVLLVLGLSIVGGLATGAAVGVTGGLWIVWLGVRMGLTFLGQMGGGA